MRGSLRSAWQATVPLGWRTNVSTWRHSRERRSTVRLGDLRRTSPIELHFGRSRGGPIDRYYIEQFLERHARDIGGHVLEFGDSTYIRRFGVGVAQIDILDIDPGSSRATIVSDVTHLDGVPSDTFDCIVVHAGPAARVRRRLRRALTRAGPGSRRDAPGDAPRRHEKRTNEA